MTMEEYIRAVGAAADTRKVPLAFIIDCWKYNFPVSYVVEYARKKGWV